jgi:hypothetical protein
VKEKRVHHPNCVVHVVSRFVGNGFFMAGQRERAEYLRRAAIALRRHDWTPLSYALMSSHVHWDFVARQQPLSTLFQPLHSGFAIWINDGLGRRGPLFADRPKTIWIPTDDTLHAIRYLHNNPVRAGCVERAADSSWTSHQSFLDPAARPDWLDVSLALRLSGYDDTPAGRRAFDEHVNAHRADPRDDALSGRDYAFMRATMRQKLGSAVEVGSQKLEAFRRELPLFAGATNPMLKPVRVDLDPVLDLVCDITRVSRQRLAAGDRSREASGARRLFVVAGKHLFGRSLTELAAYAGISVQAASKLARGSTDEITPLVERVREESVEALVQGPLEVEEVEPEQLRDAGPRG